MTKKALLAASLCAGWALQGIGPAHAQSQGYPNKPIKMVVPFPPGGPTDGMARIISERLGAVLGQSIVVENRGGGAGGSIGAKAVATADPDGYTILITPGGALTTGPAVHKNIGYDPAKAFTPVGQLIETPQIIAVHPGPAGENDGRGRSLRQGQSGQDELGLARLRHRAAPARRTVQARSRRQHRARALSRDGAHAHRRSRRRGPDRRRPEHHQPAAHPVREAAPPGGRRRRTLLRNCPTCRPWRRPAIRSCSRAVLARRGGAGRNSVAIIDKLNAAFRESLAPAETRARLDNLGAEIKVGTPQAFGKMLAEELALWTGVVNAANIKVE